MSSLVGQVVEDRATKAQYVIYHSDGNNPKVPTNTPNVYMVNIDKGKGWFYMPPQKLVSIPVNFLYRFFTKDLTRRPDKYDPNILVPSN